MWCAGRTDNDGNGGVGDARGVNELLAVGAGPARLALAPAVDAGAGAGAEAPVIADAIGQRAHGHAIAGKALECGEVVGLERGGNRGEHVALPACLQRSGGVVLGPAQEIGQCLGIAAVAHGALADDG
jgi:hypothetical protein